MTTERLLQITSGCVVASAALAAVVSGIATLPDTLLFAAIFGLSWLRSPHWRGGQPPPGGPPRSLSQSRVVLVSLLALCFIPVDYVLLSRALPAALLHFIWLISALKLLTWTSDRDWMTLYLLAGATWPLTAKTDPGAPYWLCFALFCVAGVAALLLRQMRQAPPVPPVANPAPLAADNSTAQRLPSRAFWLSVTGITLAILLAAIPLFFLLPRLSSGNTQQAAAEPEAVTTIAPRRISLELGGETTNVDPDTVIMRVKTDLPRQKLPYNLKWRGLSFDHYDGRRWTQSSMERYVVRTQGEFYKLEDTALGAELLRQTFFMEQGGSDTIFATPRTLAISRSAPTLRRDAAGNLYTRLEAGAITYVAISELPRPVAKNIADWLPIPQDIRRTDLQVPDTLDRRITELAHSLTWHSPSRYEKAQALAGWLRTRYAYTKTAPPAPALVDPLSSFLFETRAGDCEYFATALALMLRQIGIPARIASGFLTGEYNPVSASWTVRARHAHAWTEAWFPPYGWVEFDATPPAATAGAAATKHFTDNLLEAIGLWWRENVINYDVSRQHYLVSDFMDGITGAVTQISVGVSALVSQVKAGGNEFLRLTLPTRTLILAIMLLALATPLLFRHEWRRLYRRLRRWPRRHDTAIVAITFYEEALALLRTRGFVRSGTQTPLEFAHSLAWQPWGAIFMELTCFYYEARFGRATSATLLINGAQDRLRALRGALSRHHSASTPAASLQ